MSASSGEAAAPAPWPVRRSVIGVPISCTNYREAVDRLIAAARAHRPTLVTALAVHGVVEAVRDSKLGDQIRRFDVVTPDGQPVRHALNWLYGAGLEDRVYGPNLMLRLCERAAEEGVSIYLYGSTQTVVTRLKEELVARIPNLKVAGFEPSIFRRLTPAEDAELNTRINGSGAGLLFVGLGCPRQEKFAFEHRETLNVVQVCVGAAFDFHARTKRQAPAWMQDYSLEWLFRLSQEPRRLFSRYASTNLTFVWLLLGQLMSRLVLPRG
jgi:exopolysaccharide biosynthesis WecB/TagA/CpsF family protein